MAEDYFLHPAVSVPDRTSWLLFPPSRLQHSSSFYPRHSLISLFHDLLITICRLAVQAKSVEGEGDGFFNRFVACERFLKIKVDPVLHEHGRKSLNFFNFFKKNKKLDENPIPRVRPLLQCSARPVFVKGASQRQVSVNLRILPPGTHFRRREIKYV